jgi:hypothetical protein
VDKSLTARILERLRDKELEIKLLSMEVIEYLDLRDDNVKMALMQVQKEDNNSQVKIVASQLLTKLEMAPNEKEGKMEILDVDVGYEEKDYDERYAS